jgi:glycerol uptake facilitator-like aquaporin
MKQNSVRNFIVELLGTTFLVMIVFGSGIMGQTLAAGNEALALLVNSISTGLGLFVLIQSLGQLSGAHFNPVVSMIECLWGRLTKKEMLSYFTAQMIGALLGVLLTHLIFNQELMQISQTNRNEVHLWISEVIATFGLICTIALAGRKHVEFAPMTVAAYITSAYWFTSSTSFVNPAITIARAFTNTFCGMAPNGIPMYIMAQMVGALLAYLVVSRLKHNS